jgi:DHA2 family multidrug resistance protein
MCRHRLRDAGKEMAMSGATTIPVENANGTPEVNSWLIGVVVSLAAFMEVLDTSIANVALPHIAGNLGASNDESTWVLTSYLVSNAIVLPISGFLVGLLGRKRFFLIYIASFTVSSFLCGLAPSLGLLLLFRVLQGAFGGGLQPMTQAILADTFPPEKRGLAFALYGVTAICAPAIGPTLGGWLTDNYSWRWIFYINVPVGVLTVILVSQLVKDLPYLVREKNRKTSFDFVGFGILAIAVGALQVALDKGQEDDWFGSHFITALLIIAAVGLISLVIWEWFHKEPIVDVHLFKIFNFMSSCVMFFVVGIVLFSSTVLLPQFLQTLMGYTAQKAGMVLSAAAILLLILLQIVGRLTTRLQARHILAFGWITLAMGMYVTCKRIDLLISFGSATWLRIVQYLPVGFLFVPLTMTGYVGLPRNKTNAAAGLMNFMRNIGQSVGTSVVTTLIARRSQYHQSVLSAYTRSPQFNATVAELTTRLSLSHAGFDLYAAQQAALVKTYDALNAQAQALSYVDVYWLLAVTSALMFLLCFLLEKNEPGASGEIQVH